MACSFDSTVPFTLPGGTLIVVRAGVETFMPECKSYDGQKWCPPRVDSFGREA